MDKYTKSTELKCNITTSPSERPVINRRLAQLPQIVVRKRENTSKFESASGNTEVYRMGETRNDLQLTCKGFSEEDGKFLDEVEARGLETYIYSAVPGSLFHHIPLIRGVGADPTDAVYAGRLAANTTVYMPRGDTSSLVWLEETDFANNPILANGIDDQYRDENLVSRDMPLGRGVVMLSEAKNMVENSLFADNGTNVFDWTYSGGAGLNRRDLIGWMGVPNLWLWGLGVTWTSDFFDISSLVDGDNMAVSFGWRTDGTMRFRLNYVNGMSNLNEDVIVEKGCGYKHHTATIPVSIGGVGGTCRIIIELTAGNFCGMCAPQNALGHTSCSGKSYYPAFIGGSGSGVQGEITGQSLKVTGKWQAGTWLDGVGNSDSFICASGYVMPTSAGYNICDGGRIFVFEDSETGKETSCYLFVSGGNLLMYIRGDGGAWTQNVTIAGFTKGDVLHVALYMGWTGGNVHTGVKVRIVGETTTYTAEHTAAANQLTMFDTLWIGCSENENLQADCIFQDVNIWAGTEVMIGDMVEYMADPANLMEHRETVGRLYHPENHLNPNPYNRQLLDGTINCVNTRVL